MIVLSSLTTLGGSKGPIIFPWLQDLMCLTILIYMFSRSNKIVTHSVQRYTPYSCWRISRAEPGNEPHHDDNGGARKKYPELRITSDFHLTGKFEGIARSSPDGGESKKTTRLRLRQILQCLRRPPARPIRRWARLRPLPPP